MTSPRSAEALDFRTVIEKISYSKSSPVEVFKDFVRISACALACQTREEEYHEIIRRYRQEEMEQLSRAFAGFVTECERRPFADLLGQYYETISSKVSRDQRGEFFTPEPISEFMARILFDVEQVIAEGLPITLSEPACGSGGIILQVAKQLAPPLANPEKSYVDLLRVTAQDISPLACDMCYVNTTLWGIPTRVVQGNTLSGEVSKVWRNIHWMRVAEDQRLAWRQAFQLLTRPVGMQETEAPEPAETIPPDAFPSEQMELF